MLFNETPERVIGFCDKIKKETGLGQEYLIWYMLFSEHALVSDRTVIPEEVKYDLKEITLRTNNKLKSNSKQYVSIIDLGYNLAIKAFEKKGLIEYVISESGDTYPKLIGYNYINDPEFFIQYRKKGEKIWDGRMATPITLLNVVYCLNEGNEFKDKDITGCFFN